MKKYNQWNLLLIFLNFLDPILNIEHYKNLKDLSKKIETLMNNDPLRIKISRAGYNKYHRYMNSNVVAEYIINKIFKLNSRKKYLWER